MVDARLTLSDSNENPFLHNLKDTLLKAEQQVNQTAASNKFIFLDLSLDVPFMFPELKRQLVCSILEVAAELCQRGVTLVSFEQFQVDNLITRAGLP